jgi:hypothetical protein
MKKSEVVYLEPYLKYKEFILECKGKNYDPSIITHNHHIIPRHIEIDNRKNNIIKLSVEDHITAHILLSACFEIGSYEYLSNLKSARVIGKSINDPSILEKIKNSYQGEGNPFYGKSHTTESKNKISESLRKSDIIKLNYDDRYGETAEIEKDKRRQSAIKQWTGMSEIDKNSRGKKISESLKGKMAGSKNPQSFPVLVDGVRYDTMIDAVKALGKSHYKIKKYHQFEKLKK